MRKLRRQRPRRASKINWKARLLAGAIIVGAGGFTGAMIERHRAKENVEKAEENLDRAQRRADAWARLGNRVIDYHIREEGLEGEELVEDLAKMIVSRNANRAAGVSFFRNMLDQARIAVPERTKSGAVYGALAGLLLSASLSILSVLTRNRMGRFLAKRRIAKEKQTRKEKPDNGEKSGRTENVEGVARPESRQPVRQVVPHRSEERGAQEGDSLEKGLRMHCGRRCGTELAYALRAAFPGRASDVASDAETLRTFIRENKPALNQELGRYGWSIEEVLAEMEKGQEAEPMMPPIEDAERKDNGSRAPKIEKSLAVLRKARANPRGIDRKGLHTIVRKAGFNVVSAKGSGGHLRLEYEGELVRNGEGRPAIILHISSGDLPYGTVTDLLDNLISHLEQR